MSASRFTRVRRGSALVTVLMVIGIATLLSSALVGSCFFNLDFSLNQENVTIARNMADSAIAVAAMALLASPTASPSALYTVPGPDATSSGYVSFVAAGSTPWSLDNLNSSTATVGYGNQPVPGNAMHLIGSATYKGKTVYSDAVIWIPPYPYVIAATGKITVFGAMEVGAVPSAAMATMGSSVVPTGSLLPADMANNNSASPAIELSPGGGQSVFVDGNVQSVGTIYEAGNVIVDGQVIPEGQTIPIPTINVASYDTSTIPGCQTLTPAPPATMSLTGYSYYSPAPGATYTTGNINLNGGIMYVAGNLQANTISGNGAIFAEGTVTVNETANVSSDDTLALVAGGDVNLNGVGANTTAFKGMLYTQGNLNVEDLTVIGTYVANGNTDLGAGQITLTNCNMIYAPDMVAPTNLLASTSTASVSPVGYSSALPAVGAVTPEASISVGFERDASGNLVVVASGPGETFTPAEGQPVTVSPTSMTATVAVAPWPTETSTFVMTPYPQVITTWNPNPAALESMMQTISQYYNGPAGSTGAPLTLTQLNSYMAAMLPTASTSFSSFPVIGSGSGTPATITPSPFSFNNFIGSAAQNSRVLMWQPYIVNTP